MSSPFFKADATAASAAAMPTPLPRRRPPRRCPRGRGAAQARRVLRGEYAPPVDPNRPLVAAAVAKGAAAGAPALALLDRTSTAFCSSAPPRLNTAATSLVMARCSSAKPFSAIAEARSWASAAKVNRL